MRPGASDQPAGGRGRGDQGDQGMEAEGCGEAWGHERRQGVERSTGIGRAEREKGRGKGRYKGRRGGVGLEQAEGKRACRKGKHGEGGKERRLWAVLGIVGDRRGVAGVSFWPAAGMCRGGWPTSFFLHSCPFLLHLLHSTPPALSLLNTHITPYPFSLTPFTQRLPSPPQLKPPHSPLPPTPAVMGSMLPCTESPYPLIPSSPSLTPTRQLPPSPTPQSWAAC